MKLSDTLLTSTQNLFARKWRTALNLLGVVVACTMLIVTFAGTRGVAAGIDRMIAALDGVSRFVVLPDWNNIDQPPPEVYEVTAEMSEERRTRIIERLKEIWLAEFGKAKPLSPDGVEDLAKIEYVTELVPSFNHHCDITVLDGDRDDELLKRPGRMSVVSVRDPAIERDIVVGRRLHDDDADGALVDEVFAYQLGYQSDEELYQLVGKTILVEFENTRNRDDSYYLLSFLGGNTGADIREKAQLLAAITKLVSNLDESSLTPSQKDRIRKAFAGFVSPNRTEDDQPASEPGSERFFSRELTIRGVIREARREGIENLLRLARSHSASEVLVHPLFAKRIRELQKRKRVTSAVGTVDGIENLEPVVQQIQAKGYSVRSVARMIGLINNHINRILIGISVLAGIILLVAALMISNTLTISVMERTPEFGIMKAMGARDRDVLAMMLCEGAMTGVVGAIFATAVSFGLSSVIGYFVRGYVESRIGEVFTESIFHFSLLDILIAFAIGCVVCTLASVLPALRAAKLDPIVAMRRK